MSNAVAQAPAHTDREQPTPKPRRITELLLLLVALTIGIGANILVDPQQLTEDPARIITSAVVLAGGGLLVHVVLWIRARHGRGLRGDRGPRAGRPRTPGTGGR